MRLYYFFSKKECILAILEGLIFKIIRPVGPNHGGADLLTEPQPPQSQNCGYGPVIVVMATCCRLSAINIYQLKI